MNVENLKNKDDPILSGPCFFLSAPCEVSTAGLMLDAQCGCAGRLPCRGVTLGTCGGQRAGRLLRCWPCRLGANCPLARQEQCRGGYA